MLSSTIVGGDSNIEGLNTWFESSLKFLSALPDAAFVVGPDDCVIHCNTAGSNLLAANGESLVGRLFSDEFVHADSKPFWKEAHFTQPLFGNPTHQWTLLTCDGAEVRVASRASLIDAPQHGRAALITVRQMEVGTMHPSALRAYNQSLELTVDRQANQLDQARHRLSSAERSFSLLVQSVTDYAIYMLDVDGFIVSWNPGAQRIKGYSQTEVIKTHFSRFYTIDDQRSGLPQTSLKTAAAVGRMEAEGLRVRKDGTTFWASVVIDAIYDEGELVGFAKVTRDVTEKRAAEAALRQAHKMEAIGRFTGGVAHDFNNLLMAILSSLELLKKRLPADERLRSLVDTATRGAQRGASLTQRMLAFARQQELKLESVGIPEMLDGLNGLMQQTAGSNVEIRTVWEGKLPPISTDPSQFETSILNLVANARDAMPDGGTITITVIAEQVLTGAIAGLPAGSYVCIRVADTGHGTRHG